MKLNLSSQVWNFVPPQSLLPAGWLIKSVPAAVLTALLLAATLAGCSPKTPTTSAGKGGRGAGGFGPTMVSTATATNGSIGIYVRSIGTVTALKTVSISSRVQGQIIAVKYNEGQDVKAGDPLIEIDPGPSQAAVMQAEGQLKRDTAILKDARLDLLRYTEAYASNAIPKQTLDTQEAMVEQDEGTVELDQGNLDNARVQLGYCHITAPVSGRVGLRLVDEGNMVQASSTTTLVVITEIKPITVEFPVAEDKLPAILEQWRAGKTLTVDAYDHADLKKLATGKLEALDNQVDTGSGTVKFRAIFSNDDESLFPNQFVNAHLLVRNMDHATLLPNAAIQRNSDSAFVYLLKVDDPSTPTSDPASATNSQAGKGEPSGAPTNRVTGTVALQLITVGPTDGEVSAVEGIEPGTVVVANNFSKLADGAKVMVRPDGSGTGHSQGGGGAATGGAGQGWSHGGAGDKDGGGSGGKGTGVGGTGSGHRHKDQTNSVP
jgi:multidrug efflux system membrane fusion protein